RQVWVLAEGDVMVVHPAAMVAAIEAHGAPARLTDLLEPEHLSPEFVRLFHVAHVDHEVVDAARGHRLGRGLGYDRRGAVRHLQAPALECCRCRRLYGGARRFANCAGHRLSQRRAKPRSPCGMKITIAMN